MKEFFGKEMKSKKFVFGVLLILTFYLISCAPQASDEEIFSRLGDLSDEELDAALADDNTVLAGKAFLMNFQRIVQTKFVQFGSR